MKRRMIKKMITLLAVITLTAGILSGCANTKASTASEAMSVTASATQAAATATQKPTAAATQKPTEAAQPTASTDGKVADKFDATTVYLFAANSMSDAMTKVIANYNEKQPNVKISAVYDSSGTLLAQIEEAGGCDLFLSAAQKQVDTLQDKDQLLTEGTRHNLVNNQLIVMTYEGSKTAVTGIANIQKAASLAIPGGTVPAGNYTRKALIALGMLKKVEDSSLITTQQISKALGGVEINECDTVGAAAQAVSEGSNEVATCYYSDYVKYTKQGFTLKILEKVSRDLTGDIIYPVCQVKNSDADELEKKAATDFLQYMLSDEAKVIYQDYGFDTDVKD